MRIYVLISRSANMRQLSHSLHHVPCFGAKPASFARIASCDHGVVYHCKNVHERLAPFGWVASIFAYGSPLSSPMLACSQRATI